MPAPSAAPLRSVPVATAAARPTGARCPSRKIHRFYPGASPLGGSPKGTEHGGAKALKKGETCADCHSDDRRHGQEDGQRPEDRACPIPGKAAFIPVKVQAAHDGGTSISASPGSSRPPSGAAKDGRQKPGQSRSCSSQGQQIERAGQSGCWATCHTDSRTMPGADDAKTKVRHRRLVAESQQVLTSDPVEAANKGRRWLRRRQARDGGRQRPSQRRRQEGLTTGRWCSPAKLAAGDSDLIFVRQRPTTSASRSTTTIAAGRFPPRFARLQAQPRHRQPTSRQPKSSNPGPTPPCSWAVFDTAEASSEPGLRRCLRGGSVATAWSRGHETGGFHERQLVPTGLFAVAIGGFPRPFGANRRTSGRGGEIRVFADGELRIKRSDTVTWVK